MRGPRASSCASSSVSNDAASPVRATLPPFCWRLLLLRSHPFNEIPPTYCMDLEPAGEISRW